MKILLINIFILFMLATLNSFSQQGQNNNNNEQKQVSDTIKTDTLSAVQNNRQRKRDRFIDKDGDGINDNRCCGMGLHHGKGKHRGKGMGRHRCNRHSEQKTENKPEEQQTKEEEK